MLYEESTQLARWSFTRDKLRNARVATYMKALQKIEDANGGASEVAAGNSGDTAKSKNKKHLSEPLTVEQALKLLKYYHHTITRICKKYPLRVQVCALMYLKRFYIHNSVMEYDPSKVFLACIYLAGKAEEYYIPVESLCRQMQNVKVSSLLKSELVLLKGLGYDLIVHAPFIEIDGFLEDLKGLANLPEHQEAGLSVDKFDKARHSAIGAAKSLMMSDAVLLFPPGQLALAALRSGFKSVDSRLDPYLKRVLEKSNIKPEGDAMKKLLAELHEIDSYGVEGCAEVNDKEVKQIDRQLKELQKSGALAKPTRKRPKKE